MSEKLLIVEDDKKLNDGIRLALKNDAYFFYQCRTLQEAREILKKEDITLVLLDVNLPDGNGIDFVREIRKNSRVPIILLTVNNMEVDIVLILSCVGYVLFFWQKPGSVNEGISGIQIFLLYFIAMFGTIWLWSICSVILCTLLRNMWAGIGCLFGIVIGLISKAGSSFFGNLGLFSFSFCEPTQLMSESWIYGTLVSFIAGLFLFAVLPMTLKKRG